MPLTGRVSSPSNDVSNVLIINMNSKRATITDSLGNFIINARIKDTLLITAVQYLTKKIEITPKILEENLLEVELVEEVINLAEVIVTPYNLSGRIGLDLQRLEVSPEVSSSTVGLPNTDVEIMTQSERLLLEADRGKYIYYYIIGLAINTHKILNRISGRTKSLEERLARDKDLAIEEEIIDKFSKRSIAQGFDIPETEVDGFLTFCLFQADFSELSDANNATEIWNYLKAKSIQFKETELQKK